MNRADRRIRKAHHWGRPMTTTTELKTSCRLLKRQLRSTTVLPVVMGLGVAAAGAGLGLCGVRSVKAAPSASTVLPEAISRGGPPEGVRTVACNPCNPCAPNPCNPCAAANPCNPCAAANPCNPCAANPCNPCAAGGSAGASAGTTECVVPRLAAVNPCAANPCNPCSPCAASNPCAVNPCSPCPCAAANPCGPVLRRDPCGPCNPCSPCNPCAAGGAVEITDAEALRGL